MAKPDVEEICPRCKKNALNPIPALNAISRIDNSTKICPECGMDEALSDYFGNQPDVQWLRDLKGVK